MMYQCFVLSSVTVDILSRSKPSEDKVHEPRQSEIDDKQVDADKRRHQDHDDGGGPHLATRGPRHAAQLASHVDQEAPEAAEPADHLLWRFLEVVQH